MSYAQTQHSRAMVGADPGFLEGGSTHQEGVRFAHFI